MKIPRSLAFAIIGAGIIIVTMVVLRQVDESQDTSDVPAISSSLPFQTEEGWTVSQIAQILSDFGSFSKNKTGALNPVTIKPIPTTESARSYQVIGDGGKGTVSVADGVWNPASYQDLVKNLWPVSGSTQPEVTSLACASTLLVPTLDVFFAENQRISDFLTKHPDSAEGHLQAALLVGTIGLNDYSGKFRDVRIPLNRMTAHLAAADALGAVPSDPVRLLAEGIRLTLCGQQADALAAVETWPETPELGEWAAILRLRNTLDWRNERAAAMAGSAGLQYEYFRALARAIESQKGIEFLEEIKAEPEVTYWRAANETKLSVQTGHVFTKPILGIEIEDAAKAAQHFEVKVSEDNLNWLKEYMDSPEGSPVTDGPDGREVQVAGRNLFAGYHQRHFMQGASRLFGFFNNQWGVADAARELDAFIKRQLPDMRYKPFLVRMIACTREDARSANVPLEAIIKNNPERVTPALWAILREDQSGEQILQAPDFHSWFSPEVPQGTAFESGERLHEIGVGDENNDVWMKTLWERAPYVYSIALHNAYLENNRSYDSMPGSILKKWLGPQADIDLRAMQRVARSYENQPALYESSMVKAAELDPDLYIKLGNYFLGTSDEEKAAKYYLEAFEKANDRVWMANSSKWLIQYLVRNNQLETAAAVAEDSSETYSHSGLEAAQWFAESQGDWDESLATAVKIDERYNDGEPVCELATLIRLQETMPEKTADFSIEEKTARVFPDGVKKVKIDDFADAPQKGVLLTGTSRALESFGLRRNMVIVALNGYQTDTVAQYDVIRALSDDPAMSLIAWDGNTYLLSEGSLPNRRFNVDITDYRP